MRSVKSYRFWVIAFIFCFFTIPSADQARGETQEAGERHTTGAILLSENIKKMTPHHEVSDGSYWMAPEKEARLVNPVNPTEDSVARGKEIFVDKCIKCHGDTGRGDGILAGSLFTKPADLVGDKISTQPDGALFYKISKGKGAMPAWEVLLTGEDRWHLINYIHSLKQYEGGDKTTDTNK